MASERSLALVRAEIQIALPLDPVGFVVGLTAATSLTTCAWVFPPPAIVTARQSELKQAKHVESGAYYGGRGGDDGHLRLLARGA